MRVRYGNNLVLDSGGGIVCSPSDFEPTGTY